MRYLDKSLARINGTAITEAYIKNHCKDSDGRYVNINYEDFCSLGYGEQMKACLKQVQGNFCCYCMRDMSMNNGVTTLEHIVPQNPMPNDVVKYRALKISALQTGTLLLVKEFIKHKTQNMPPYPHNVAYDNFLISCNGKFPEKAGSSLCCNNKRGNDYAIPLPLYQDVDQMVKYSEDGDIMPNHKHSLASDIAIALGAYRVKCDNLKTIRRMWYLFRNTDYQTLINCINDSELRYKTLMNVLFKDSKYICLDAIIVGKYIKPDYWKTFISYHWFQNEYRKMYP